MQNIVKNKFMTTFLSFMFVLVGALFVGTPKVHAKLNDNAFWGITANFNANAVEGFVVNVNEDSYQEKFSSVFYGTGSVPLKSIREKVGSIYVFNPYYMIDMNNGTTTKKENTLTKEVTTKITSVNSNASANTNTKVQDVLTEIASKRKTNTFTNLIGDDWGAGNLKSASGKKAKELRKINAVYTWPHWQGAGDITEAEVQYITKLSSVLTNDYNSAISMLLNNNKKSLGITSASPSQKMAFLNLIADIAITAQEASKTDGSVTLSVNYSGLGKEATNGIEVKAKFQRLTSTEFKALGYNKINGLSNTDVVKITILNGTEEGDSVTAIWRYPKGYAAGQDLYNILVSRKGTGIFDKSAGYGYTSKLDWTHIAYQAIFNFEVSGTDSTGAGDLYVKDDGLIGNMFASLINSIIQGLTGILGLYTLEELCLNTGGRGVAYWNGIFPTSWFSASQYFYLFTFTLAMLMLLIAMVRLAGQKAASTIGNVAKRISLLEGIKKIVICSICTMLFVPIFTVLVNLNNMIVTTLTKLIPAGASLNFTTGSLSGMGLAGAIVSIMLFWVTIKMNFTYILRAITILLCYILAPIAIMCSAVGDKFGQITSNWLKELLGNIFIQAVHALIMMVFITIAGSGSVAKIEKLVLIYSFVPLTEFVRTNLFALGKGLDQVAENLGQGIKDGATAATGAAFAGKMAGKAGGNATLQGKAGNIGMDKTTASLNEKSQGGLASGKVGSWVGEKADRIKSGAKSVVSHPLKSIGGAAAAGAKVGYHGAKAGLAMGGMLASGAMSSSGRMSHMATMYGARNVGSNIGAQFGDVGEYFGGLADMQAQEAAKAEMGNLKETSYEAGRSEEGDVALDNDGRAIGAYAPESFENWINKNPGLRQAALDSGVWREHTTAEGKVKLVDTRMGTSKGGGFNMTGQSKTGKQMISSEPIKAVMKDESYMKNATNIVSKQNGINVTKGRILSNKADAAALDKETKAIYHEMAKDKANSQGVNIDKIIK